MVYAKSFFLLTTLSAVSLFGIDYTWNTGSSGTWDTSGNWTPNTAYPNSSADTATFPNTGVNVTVDGIFAVDSLTFNSTSSYSIISGGGGDYLLLGGGSAIQNIVLTNGNSATQSISVPLNLAGPLGIEQDSSFTLTVSGTISGNYSVSIDGMGAASPSLIFSGTNTYTGSTTIESGLTLAAESITALAPNSSFTVSGILDLMGNNNTILSLNGAGIVQLDAATLTITNGGVFAGTIGQSGDMGALVLNGGTLTLSGTNNYSGGTTITAGTLALSGAGQLLPAGAVIDDGTFDISGISPATSTTIGDLSGNGYVALGNNTLILGTSNSTTFSGIIENGSMGSSGSLTYQGTGSLTLSGANTYSGATTINAGGTLIAGITNAFAPQSNFTVNGTLNLNNFANTINMLSGTGSVTTGGSSGILTISNGGIFSGGVTGLGGLTVTGGTLQLTTTTSANTYSGTTTVTNAGTLQAGANNAFSSASAVNLISAGILNVSTFSNTISSLNGTFNSLVNIGSGGILTIGSGGMFAGVIQGAGSLQLQNGTLTLTNANSYTGGTTIASPATLLLKSGGELASSGSVTVNGTFDISQSTSASETIGNLSGNNTGVVNLGANELIVNLTTSSSYAGSLQGSNGSFTLNGGSNTLTLSGTSSYTGSTNVASGTLQAGSTTAFAPLSNFTVNGILDLNSNNNSIYTLNGTGTVTSSSGLAILTLGNGGVFGGQITSNAGITLNGGTLFLNASGSDYSDTTTINNGTTLQAGATNAFSPNSAVVDSGTLALANFANTIYSLSGSGNVTTGGATGLLTIGHGGTFSGGITGSGGLIVTGGTLELTTTTSANTYSGPTTVSNSTLEAGAVNAFSPNSAVTLDSLATLNLAGFNNTLYSLASSAANSAVTLGQGTLTINSNAMTTFAGSITDSGPPCGALTINGGNNLTLTNTANHYCGPTSIINGTLQLGAAGALSPVTAVTVSAAGTLIDLPNFANSAISIDNLGTVNSSGVLTLANTYTQDAAAALDLLFQTGVFGEILTSGNITLDGSLTVTAGGTFPNTGIWTLLGSSPGLVSGMFSSFTPVGFGSTDPHLVYSLHSVDLFFSICAATWQNPGNGSWGNGSNWNPACIPGANGNQNDVASFVNINSVPTIVVTLADASGTAPESFTLFQINFDSSGTQYTIEQYSSASTITLDANPSGTPQINVILGQSTIDAPLILNQSSELVLSDGAQLTFNPNTTLISTSTQNFTIRQSSSSSIGSGLLVNNGTLTPYGMTILSASVLNKSTIMPLNSLLVEASAGQNVFINNSGISAMMGTTANYANVVIGGAGTTTVNNNGIAAQFGPTGLGSNLAIGSTGTTKVTNSGIGSVFGPTGNGGNFTVQGSGTTVTNSGLNTKMGAFGTGGNVTIKGGTVNNKLGALLQAGQGGVFSITGGTVTNDLISTVGTTTENMFFTGGTFITSGNVLSYDYTQSGTSILQLNLTSLPSVIGNIAASGNAIVGSALVVDALPGAQLSAGQVVDLITAKRGVTGTYSSVTFLGFPAGVIPTIIYTPTAVELALTSTVTNNPVGSLSQVEFISVNEDNFLIEREILNLHSRILERNCKKGKGKGCQKMQTTASNVITDENLIVAADPRETAVWEDNTKLKENQLVKKVAEEKPANPSRFYFGPTDSIGNVRTEGTSQVGFGYNSVGVFTGFDHAFRNWGLGVAANYSSTRANDYRHAGHFDIQNIHGSMYATWVPSSLQELSVDGIVGGSYQWYNIYRKIDSPVKPLTSKGDPQGTEVDALLGVEYIFSHPRFPAMPSRARVIPFLNGQYIWDKVDDYQEHDASIYGLKVERQYVHSLRTCLGARFDYLVERKNVTFLPEFAIAWQYEFLDRKRSLNFTTIDLPTVKSVTNTINGAGRNTLLLGVDFFITVHQVYELEFSYDFQWNSLYKNNAFYLGLGGNF